MTHIASTPQDEARKGLIIASLGGMALTVDVPLIRLAHGDVWSVLAVRSGGTFLVAIVIWLAYRVVAGRRLTLVPGRGGLAVAGLYSLSALTFITAVFNTTTANLVFILAFNTVFSALLSWIFLKERPLPPTLAAMAAMLVGVAIIVNDGISAGHMLGDAMALASALLMAAAITTNRSLRCDLGFTPLVANAVPAVIAMFMVSRTGGLEIQAPVWILLNGLLVIPLSFWCLATGPRYLSATGSGDVLSARDDPRTCLGLADLRRGPLDGQHDRRRDHDRGARRPFALADIELPSHRPRPHGGPSGLTGTGVSP